MSGPQNIADARPAGEIEVSVVKANAELKQKPLKHTPHDFTIKRNEQREVEALALAEALGDWSSRLLGRPVRGAEGFFEDTASGVVPCLILRKLGVNCEPPRDPPRNEFEAKENRQKFQKACIRAGFASIPSFDREPATGLIPTLIECAAIDQAQRRNNHTPDIVPDAITKRTGELIQSEAIKSAVEGRMVAQALPKTNDLSPLESATVTKPPGEMVTKPVALANAVEKRTAAKTAAKDVRQVAKSETSTRGSKDNDDATSGDMGGRRSRTASEIPQHEKDQIFTNAMGIIAAIACLIILLYWLTR